jgi:hypothetical protein
MGDREEALALVQRVIDEACDEQRRYTREWWAAIACFSGTLGFVIGIMLTALRV